MTGQPPDRPGDLTYTPPADPVPGVGAVVESEFASIAVTVDGDGHSPRLRLVDLRTGRVRLLDALELEAVVWLPDGDLTHLLDPSADRWRG